MERQIGQTKDVGFQFGIRKTFLISNEDMWDFLFSPRGLRIWLGDLETEFAPKQEFVTKNGIKGFVRLFKPHSHIRINWQMEDWTNLSVVQLRTIKNRDKTTLSFSQQKLTDSKQREFVKTYWTEIMEKITNELQGDISR